MISRQGEHMNKLACGLSLSALILLGCHTITEELPTQPTNTPKKGTGLLTVSIPAIPGATPAPTPKPTPAPTATPAPAPSPDPTPTPPPQTGTKGCGNPVPPPITKMGAYVHIKGPNQWTLDVTPLVGPDAEYCRADRIHRRALALPGPAGGPSRARGVRAGRRRLRGGHGTARADVDPQWQLLQGRRRLRQPSGQPVPALGAGGRLLRGLHQGRHVRRRPGRPLG